VIGHYVRARLHRRIFVWFGATILLTGLTVGLVVSLVGTGGPGWRRDYDGVKAFLGERFERVWDEPVARGELMRSIATNMDTGVVVFDRERRPMYVEGTVEARCEKPAVTAPITRRGEVLGYVELCFDRHRMRAPWRIILPLLAAWAVLWGASGKIARRISRPLAELSRVAGEIGAGNLSSRVRLGRHQPGEVGLLADAVNDMAARIERQMADQRELLAAVSHEIRTPLQRIRLVVELARDNGATPKTFDELDREVLEIDALVGELLASSRLDFAAVSTRKLDGVEVARRALERAGIDAERLAVEGDWTKFEGDATLIARALANLVDNAKKHGGGLVAMRVRAGEDALAFEVDDDGVGFAPGDEARAFESFYRSADGERDHASLGLGLALVKRIAEAHGGRAYAENRPGGGARVGFEVRVERRS